MLKILLATAAIAVSAGAVAAENYTVTVTNTMETELLAPILITNAANDAHIFEGHYVTKEAENQILTGEPKMLAERIGADAMVGHGMDGPPGVRARSANPTYSGWAIPVTLPEQRNARAAARRYG